MTPQLTPEIRDALAASGGAPVQINDHESHRAYLIVPLEQLPALMEAHLVRELQIGLDEFDRGDVIEFDEADFRNRSRERLITSSVGSEPGTVLRPGYRSCE